MVRCLLKAEKCAFPIVSASAKEYSGFLVVLNFSGCSNSNSNSQNLLSLGFLPPQFLMFLEAILIWISYCKLNEMS